MPKKTQNKVPETIIVGDTSALISLGVGGILSKCLETSRILIPQKVYNELSEISQSNDIHGKAAQENTITILITDDFRSLPNLKTVSGDVEIHLSIYLLARLVLEKLITITEARDALNRISEGRTWESAAIYNLAKKYIEELKEDDRK